MEIELKFQLASQDELDAFTRALNGNVGDSVAQVNHFFDTPSGALNRAKHTLRLREEAGREPLLTAKGPERHSADGLLSEKDELEARIGRGLAESLLRSETSALDALSTIGGAAHPLCIELRRLAGAETLSPIGSFTNTRTPVEATLTVAGRARPLLFELDHTTFPDGTASYEFELELGEDWSAAEREETIAAIRAILRENGIEPGTTGSKAKRFFAALGKAARS
jgi:uncharacterized protein YjbK